MFSWYYSSGGITNVVFWLGLSGAVLEVLVAVAAFIDLRNEKLDEAKEKKIERFVVVAAAIAAVISVSCLLLSQRGSKLQDNEHKAELKEQIDKLARAESKVVELESKQLPRQLNPEQREKIASKLLPFQNTPVDFITYPDNKEALDFTNDIARALLGARWIYKAENRSMLLGSISGVIVDVHDNADSRLKSAATNLVDALKSEGVVVYLANKAGATDRVMVTVGIKP